MSPQSDENPKAPPPSEEDKARAEADRMFRVQRNNAIWLMILAVGIYFLLDIHLPALAGWLAAGVAAPGLLSLSFAWKVASSGPFEGRFLGQLAKRLGDIMDLPQATSFLAGAALIVLPGAGFDWYLHNHFSILRIVPGPELTDLLADTGISNQQVYEIVVSLGRKTRNEVSQWTEEPPWFPRDASSISIGASEYFLRWRASRDSELANKQASALLAKLYGELRVDDHKDDQIIIASWNRNPVFVPTHRLRGGDEIRISFRCRRSGLELFGSPDELVTNDQPRLKTIVLEPTTVDDFLQKARQCEPTSP